MSSANNFMSGMLPLVEDKKIKTGCFTFDILIDGTIEATRHPAGYICKRKVTPGSEPNP